MRALTNEFEVSMQAVNSHQQGHEPSENIIQNLEYTLGGQNLQFIIHTAVSLC